MGRTSDVTDDEVIDVVARYRRENKVGWQMADLRKDLNTTASNTTIYASLRRHGLQVGDLSPPMVTILREVPKDILEEGQRAFGSQYLRMFNLFDTERAVLKSDYEKKLENERKLNQELCVTLDRRQQQVNDLEAELVSQRKASIEAATLAQERERENKRLAELLMALRKNSPLHRNRSKGSTVRGSAGPVRRTENEGTSSELSTGESRERAHRPGRDRQNPKS